LKKPKKIAGKRGVLGSIIILGYADKYNSLIFLNLKEMIFNGNKNC
jgi:hypothetical protein